MREIMKFKDFLKEASGSLDIDKIIKDIKAIDTKNIADVKVETVSSGNYIDVSFKNSSAQTKVAKAINKKFNYNVDFDGTHLLVTVKGL